MAYQPKSKSYNKFVATAATATLVASAVAPIALADEVSTAAFTDVSERYAEAVDYVVTEGIAIGLEPTRYGVGESIKRVDAAIMIAKASGLMDENAPASGFSDVPDRAAVAVNSLKAAGVINGKADGSFGSQDNITRGQAAFMLAQAYNLEEGNTAAMDFTDVGANHRFAEEIAALVENNITDGVNDTQFGTENYIKRGDFAIFLHRLYELTNVEAPSVASVTALNGKELQVQFNTALDADDAVDLANYSLTGEKFTAATLSEDGKTVVLTVEDTINVENATLEIAPIVTKADANVSTEKYVSLFTYVDNDAPAVASIQAEGTSAVVSFDEALKSEGTVSLDGVELVEDTDYTVNGKTLTIINLTAEQSYKLDIVGATDFADNMSGQITSYFTVAKPVVDDVKPTVSTSVTGNKLTLSFSEKVTPGTVTIGGTSVTADLVASEDQKTFTVDVQEAGLFNGKTFITGEVVVAGFEDMTPNAMNEVKFNATFTADTTAPKFVTSSIKTTGANATDDKILLTFDDAVYEGTLEGADELVIKTIDGIFQSNNTLDLTAANVSYGYDLDGNNKFEGNENNIVAITFDAQEESSYTFGLAGKIVTDVYGNAVSDTINFSAVAPKYVEPTTPVTDKKDVAVTSLTVADNNTDLTVVFNKDMSNSAVTASNYSLGGKALPSGTTLKFVDNRKNVVISLPQGSITANGVYAFEATNLTDVAGNTLLNGKVSTTLPLEENVLPVATTVSVLDSKNFTVDFTEALVDPTTVTGVTVKVNGTVAAANISVVNGDLTVTTANNFALTDSLSVEFNNTNLADINGNNVANGTVTK